MKLRELIAALQSVADQEEQPEGYPPVAEWDIEIILGPYPDTIYCYEPVVRAAWGTVEITK